MPLPPPASDVQVAFLQNVQRLLAEGLFTATYKFALLQALADLAVLRGDDSGDELILTTRDIAEAMVRLYWRQAAPFPTGRDAAILRQSTHGQAEVLSLIIEARDVSDATLVGAQHRLVAWDRLVRRVQRVVHEQPLWKLQTVGAQPLKFLYPNVPGSRTITLRLGVSFCLRSFHGLISELVRAAWLRHVRRVNGDALGSTVDLSGFLFGTERTSLGSYQPFLAELQRGLCFYCGKPLGARSEVDHFIPWARYPVDLGHNFVVAHGACNQSKSSHLGDVPYLERWVDRNDLNDAALVQWFQQARVDYDLSASQHVARWAYAQTERASGQVWTHGRTLVPLDPSWTLLLPGTVT